MNEYKEKALEIINEWNDMDPEQQLRFCMACVCKAIKQGQRLAHGNELGDAVNSTYITVTENLLDADKLSRNIERRTSKGFSDSLVAIVSRAAKSKLQREIDREKRDSVVISDTATNSNGQKYSLLDTIAGSADTEKAAIIKAELKRVYNGLDDTSKTILDGMVRGKTEREITPSLGITAPAVHKRIVKIRAELAELL